MKKNYIKKAKEELSKEKEEEIISKIKERLKEIEKYKLGITLLEHEIKLLNKEMGIFEDGEVLRARELNKFL